MIAEVELDGRTIILVGTAHVSEESRKEVVQAIEQYEPDKVCVELDDARLEALTGDSGWKDKDVAAAIKEGRGYLMLFNILLSIYQRRIGEEYSIEPGAEMLAAIEAAEEQDLPTELIDRDINITLKRAMNELGLWEKLKLGSSMLEGFFHEEDVDVEELKQQDMIHEVMAEFAGRFPSLKRALIDERDRYMADRLRETTEETVVAVVGAGHLDGIKKELEAGKREEDDLTSVEEGVGWMHVLKYAFPAAILGVFAYGYFSLGASAAGSMFSSWFWFNAVLASVGAVVALAHPLTIGVSFIAAPFTSVNPAVPAGLVAAYAENRLRPPRVEDMESLGEIASYRDLWNNRATKLLLVFFLVNLGSSIGSFLGAGAIIKIAGLF